MTAGYFFQTGIDQFSENVGLQEAFAPGGVEFRRWFGGDGFGLGFARINQRLDVVAGLDQHIPIGTNLITVRQRAVAWNNFGVWASHANDDSRVGDHTVY